MASRRKKRGAPLIPQQSRIQNKLKELLNAFMNLVECRREIYRNRPGTDVTGVSKAMEDLSKVTTYLLKDKARRDLWVAQEEKDLSFSPARMYASFLDNLYEIAKDLVHLHLTQLHHPIIQWLIPQLTRDKLRGLHRGLETGVGRGLEAFKGVSGKDDETRYANAEMIRNALVAYRREDLVDHSGQEPFKPRSLLEVQKILDDSGWIEHMSPKGYYKLVKRIEKARDPRIAYQFNVKALPPRPKKNPPEWLEAEKVLSEARDVFPTVPNQKLGKAI